MSETSISSYEPNKLRNRRYRVPSNPWLPYIGDCKALEKYLKSKQGVGWLIPKYFNAVLRGISQVVFANNPLAGLVILVALFWSNVIVGLAATVAATTAICAAMLMRQDPALISAGLTSYNAVLVGTITSSLWTPLYGEVLGHKLWSFIILGSALSVFVTSAIASILSSLKISLPALTVPFNVVTLVIFICLMPVKDDQREPVELRLQQSHLHETVPFHANHLPQEDQDQLRLNVISRQIREIQYDRAKREVNKSKTGRPETKMGETKDEVLDWGKILLGIISSAGQVYGVNDMIGSILIYIGIMVYSPILFMMSVFGAIVGTICGTWFASAPYETIYAGIWGYNGLLSAGAVGGLFITLTCYSFWNAMANVIFTVLIQQALSVVVTHMSLNLPIFTFPFVLSTLLFLSVTTSGNQLPRVQNISFPEMHRYDYRENSRVKRIERQENQCKEIPEEKELVLTDIKVISEEVVQVETVVGRKDDSDNEKELETNEP